MGSPFIKLGVLSAGVAKISPLDVKDYYIDTKEVGAKAQWDLKDAKISLSNLANPSNIMRPAKSDGIQFSDKSLTLRKGAVASVSIDTGVSIPNATSGLTAAMVVKLPIGVTGDLLKNTNNAFQGVVLNLTSQFVTLKLGTGINAVTVQVATLTAAPIYNGWCFIGFSIKQNSTGIAEGSVLFGSDTAGFISGSVAGDKAYLGSNANITISDPYGSAGTNYAEFSEVVLFDSFKSTVELQQLYNNAKLRAKEKGIIV